MDSSGHATYKGRLGQTTRAAVHVTSDAGTTFAATIYTAIDTDDAPELLSALKEGSLHQVTDPHNGKLYALAQPVVLHDPVRPLFALYLPDALRHRESEERRRLLTELDKDDASLPAYVRDFVVVHSVEAFKAHAAAALPEAPAPAVDPLAEQRAAFEVEKAHLKVERQQLQELRERFDRERAQMDEIEERIARERAELLALREQLAAAPAVPPPAPAAPPAKVEAPVGSDDAPDEDDAAVEFDDDDIQEALEEVAQSQEVNTEDSDVEESDGEDEGPSHEPPPPPIAPPAPPAPPVDEPRITFAELEAQQRQIAEQHGGVAIAAEESTQIVTDDQFIEMVGPDEAEDLASEVSEIVDDEGIEVFEPESTLINALTTGLPSRFADFKTSGDRVTTLRDEHIVLAARAPRADIEVLFADHTEFYVQLHELEGYPVIGLVIVNLKDGKATGSVGWPLDVADPNHCALLDKLGQGMSVRAGLYEPLGSLLRAVEIQSPLRSNVAWIVDQANAMLDASSGSFEPAARKYVDRAFERVGAMRHPFFTQAFSELGTPSEIKLAAGIVGFWSQPEKLLYVLANRTFPCRRFQDIQDRVIRAAVDSGIFLTKPLRERAVALGLADSEDHLAERLFANFAEVCISLKVNDLEPASQWENWDALLGLGEELGLPPDPDVVELAEVSLKRAQELAELEESDEPSPIENGQMFSVDRTLVVARQSESTGVTYFLPDDAIMDSFEDIAGLSRNDLELLLGDPKGRLEAAQVLIEQYGPEGLAIVLEASENMSSPEVAALARFVETKGESLEGELVRTLGSIGPSGSYIAVHALSSVRSTTAIPAILDVIRDPKQNGDVTRLVRAIAQYGDRLLPALTRAIKRDGPMSEYVELLVVLEDSAGGTLANLSKDRSKVLRDAARMAREKRDSR